MKTNIYDENKIKSCTTLEELFKIWKTEQNNESDDSCNNTFPKKGIKKPPYEFKKSFCVDGFLGNKITEISVLYVLKESNCNGEGEFNDNFWLRECLAKGNDKQAEKYIGWMEKKYIEDKDEFTSRETLFNTAAMLNLNKRGGYGGTNYAQLKHYVNKYHDFIKREIEIINPDIIICAVRLRSARIQATFR